MSIEGLGADIPRQLPTDQEMGGCADCVGICCSAGTSIELSPVEREQLESQGAVLEPTTTPEALGAQPVGGRDFYILVTDCGNLDPQTRTCSDYENRPGICREFAAGSFACRMMQQTTANLRERRKTDLPMPGFRRHLKVQHTVAQHAESTSSKRPRFMDILGKFVLGE